MTRRRTLTETDRAGREATIDQFHDHIDRAVVAAVTGRPQRVTAYLAAAERLLTALPADVVTEFELAGHLAGVARGLLGAAASEPLIA